MVRLILVLAPVMCVMGGISVNSLLMKYMKDIDLGKGSSKDEKKLGKKDIGGNQSRKNEVIGYGDHLYYNS